MSRELHKYYIISDETAAKIVDLIKSEGVPFKENGFDIYPDEITIFRNGRDPHWMSTLYGRSDRRREGE